MSSESGKWLGVAALIGAVGDVVATAIHVKRPDQDPALHERVALLEKRVEDLERVRWTTPPEKKS